MERVILTLQVFQGKVTYDAQGNVTSENHLMKLEYNTKQFDIFLLSAKNFFTRIKFIKATDGVVQKDGSIKEIEVSPELIKRIESCLSAPEAKLTPEQEKIKELEAKINALVNGATPKSEKVVESSDELEVARAKYEELYGEKPHHKLSLAKLNAAIAEKQ